MKNKNINMIIALLLCFCLSISMAACGNGADTSEIETPESATSETATSEEASPETATPEDAVAEMTDEEALALAVEIVATEKGKTIDKLTEEEMAEVRAKADELLADNKAELAAEKNGDKTDSSTSSDEKAEPVAATSIYFKSAPTSVNVGKTADVGKALNFVPYSTTDKSVTYSTSNSKVATVSASGIVTGKSAGTVTVTAKSGDLTAAVTMTVIDTSAPVVAAESVSLSPSAVTVQVGKVTQLSAAVSPNNATNKTVSYSTSDSKVATVNANGVVTGKAVGTATITVKTANGKADTCKVTVEKATVIEVTGVSATLVSNKIEVGKTTAVNVALAPTTATNRSVSYASSDATVASVNASGVVTGKKAGTATITVTSANGKTGTCSITVVAASASTPTTPTTGGNNSDLASQAADLINAQRSAAGLSQCSISSSLTATAQARAVAISTDFNHHGTAREIISQTTIGVSSTVNGWMNSPGHKAIMLDSTAYEMGVGCYVVNGTQYYVAIFNVKTESDTLSNCSLSGPTTVTVGDTVTYTMSNVPNGCTVDGWSSSLGTMSANGNSVTITVTRAGSWTVAGYIYRDGKIVACPSSIRVTSNAASTSQPTTPPSTSEPTTPPTSEPTTPPTSQPTTPPESTPAPTCPVCGSTEHTTHPAEPTPAPEPTTEPNPEPTPAPENTYEAGTSRPETEVDKKADAFIDGLT